MNRSKHILFSIKGLSHQIKRSLDLIAVNKDDQLTGVQRGIIGYIGDHMHESDLFQKDIEEVFNIRRSTATGILQLMEKNGYIKRKSVIHDARLKKLALTEKALKHHAQATIDIEQLAAQATAGISEEEINSFLATLKKISNNLE